MFTIPLICPKCSHQMGEVLRKKKFKEVIKSALLCKECKETSLQKMRERERSFERKIKNSERMKVNNPMFVPETRAKIASTNSKTVKNVEDYLVPRYTLPRLSSKDMSEKMKQNNPMHNQAIVDKMKKTFKQRIKSGEIIYKRGPEHHLWKGNRDFNNSVRLALYPIWVCPILQRDGFKCVKCGNKQNLQVHHVKPLRKFLDEIKKKYQIKTFSKISIEDLYPYVTEVINNHKLEDGITVCESCHSKIDELYYKGKKK